MPVSDATGVWPRSISMPSIHNSSAVDCWHVWKAGTAMSLSDNKRRGRFGYKHTVKAHHSFEICSIAR
jgi:hypothetical protein